MAGSVMGRGTPAVHHCIKCFEYSPLQIQDQLIRYRSSHGWCMVLDTSFLNFLIAKGAGVLCCFEIDLQ